MKTLPGVREAIEQREYADVDAQIVLAAGIIDGMTSRIEVIVALQKDE